MVRASVLGRAAVRAALLSFMVAVSAAVTMTSMMTAGLAQSSFRKDKLTLKTSSGDHPIAIEVAVSNEEKSLGLMYRPNVPANTGMLFPYERPQELTMWMKNTYASLDMVFIKADGVVHRVEYSTEPMSERVISSKGNVLAVLELAAGEAKRLAIQPGDKVEHSTFKPGKK